MPPFNSPYLTPPQRGTWQINPDGTMLHLETGSLWRTEDGKLLNPPTDSLDSEFIIEDILDAEEIG